MKRLFTLMIVGLSLLLTSCSNQKYKTLESKNKQLQHQIDSLKQDIDSCRKVATRNAFEAKRQHEIAELQALMADKSAAEAKRQMRIALIQSDSAAHAKNRAIKNALEAARQRDLYIECREKQEKLKTNK
jgi:outer membrane murein-binding lipoprotein Lpp